MHKLIRLAVIITFSGAVISCQTSQLNTNQSQPERDGVAKSVELIFSRLQLESKWRVRIQSFIDRGVVPIIDLQSGVKRRDIRRIIPDGLRIMDELGIALIAFDGRRRSKDRSKGYRWSYYIRALVNRYPDYFIPTTNGGVNSNWIKQKGGASWDYIDQMEKYVRAGIYAHIGEIEVRHYPSNGGCKRGKERDVDIPLERFPT